MRHGVMLAAILAGMSAICAQAQASQPIAPRPKRVKTVAQAYPTLASGALLHATPADLPKGVLLRASEIKVAKADLDARVAKAPQAVREQLRKNAFFVLEQMATRQLLLREARAALAKDGKDTSDLSEQGILKAFFDKLTADAEVSDGEIADFYDKNKDTVGGQKLENVKGVIVSFLRQQKRQEITEKHIRTMGQRTAIEVDAAWLKEQAKLAMDNPVNKVRASGKPSLVDFGSHGCIPCDKLTPILDAMKAKYQGKANVLFVSVRQEQILASRYGIQSIPVQIFFDAAGKEAFRHVGFWPREELEKKLAELGAK